MAPMQPAARLPHAVAGLPSNGNHTTSAPFDVPSFDDPMGERPIGEIMHAADTHANTQVAAAATIAAAAPKTTKQCAVLAVSASTRRIRDLLSTPAATLQPSGNKSSSGKKRKGAALQSHAAQAPRPKQHASPTPRSNIDAAGIEGQDGIGDVTAGDALAHSHCTPDAEPPSTPSPTAAVAPAAAAVPVLPDQLLYVTALLDDPAGGHVFEAAVGKTPEGLKPGGVRPAAQRIAEARLMQHAGGGGKLGCA